MTIFSGEQILLSIAINAVVFIALPQLKSAPPRMVLCFCLAGMLAIVIPWMGIGTGLESYVPQKFIFESADSNGIMASVPSRSEIRIPINALVFSWLVVGVTWLAILIWRSTHAKRQLRSRSTLEMKLKEFAHPEFNHLLQRARVYRLPNSTSVFSTGVWRPEIWIGSDIRSRSQLEAALNHELAHIAYRDQITLFLIVVLERLLWWNPLIWLLGKEARRQMEYACDSRCKSLLGADRYRRSLAELIVLQQPPSASLSLTLGNKSDLITRLEKIEMKHQVKPNHVVTLMLAGSIAGVTSASIAAEDLAEQSTLMGCHQLLPEGVQYDFRITSDIDTREGQKGQLSVTLIDESQPDSREIPEGAGEFLRCVQKVVGVGENEDWPKS